MASEELFLRIDTYNQLNLAKERVNEHNIEEVYSLYHVLCTFNERKAEEYIMDKNEFRYIQESDTIEGKKWYHELIEFIREEIESMLDMVRKNDS